MPTPHIFILNPAEPPLPRPASGARHFVRGRRRRTAHAPRSPFAHTPPRPQPPHCACAAPPPAHTPPTPSPPQPRHRACAPPLQGPSPASVASGWAVSAAEAAAPPAPRALPRLPGRPSRRSPVAAARSGPHLGARTAWRRRRAGSRSRCMLGRRAGGRPRPLPVSGGGAGEGERFPWQRGLPRGAPPTAPSLRDFGGFWRIKSVKSHSPGTGGQCDPGEQPPGVCVPSGAPA